MSEHLVPLQRVYGDALQILTVNVETPAGQSLYRGIVRRLAIPNSRVGVPALFVGNQLLVGSGEIPEIFPGIVAEASAGAGLAWPALPGLGDYLEDGQLAEGLDPSEGLSLLGGGSDESVGPRAGSSWTDRFMADPAGNAMATVVLLCMVVTLVLSFRAYLRGRPEANRWPGWIIPVLAVVGLGIAGYLAFVETAGVEAVCGPVGDCNRVQQSEWAHIAGVPIGVLGVLGYLAVGATAVLRVVDRPRLSTWSGLTWALAAIGVAFSIYLTFLEPFVIGATCIWCVSSALVMTAILVAATPDAARARGGAGAT
jgi:uncharacterized membrane protein